MAQRNSTRMAVMLSHPSPSSASTASNGTISWVITLKLLPNAFATHYEELDFPRGSCDLAYVGPADHQLLVIAAILLALEAEISQPTGEMDCSTDPSSHDGPTRSLDELALALVHGYVVEG